MKKYNVGDYIHVVFNEDGSYSICEKNSTASILFQITGFGSNYDRTTFFAVAENDILLRKHIPLSYQQIGKENEIL